MISITGIQIEKNAKGQNAFIRIDLEKYGKQLQPFLQQVGIMEDDFEKEWANSITEEELIKRVSKYIKSLPWKK